MNKSHLLALLFLILAAFYLYETKNMVGLVIVTGFLDGIHPCGFTVLIFFIAFLLSLKRSRKEILLLGSLYILGVFIAYFSIGLGIMNAVSIFEPHFMAKAGALLLVLVGAISIKDGIMGTSTLKIPKFSQPYVQRFLEQGTALAALIAGILVGLCAFPCVGGLYVAIITLLSAKGLEASWLGLLALYNLMFVVPLILALGAASSEQVLEKVEGYEKTHRKAFKLMMGLMMLLFGLYILIWSAAM
ncbi:MAG: cytochrome c biogenesis protein CcdA [Candidatus Anstonellaceae archaeon]